MAEQPEVLTRALLTDVVVRSINEEKRSAMFVAATEKGVPTMMSGKNGMPMPEHLRLAGMSLQRYGKNPVVLDTHDRFTIEAIVGSARMMMDEQKHELGAEITFADTPRGDIAWKLVRGGFLRALSVGFVPDRRSIIQLNDGKTDGDGDGMIMGPAIVIKKSELFEVSVCPVPTDADAVRRAMSAEASKEEYTMSNQGTPAPAPVPQPGPAAAATQAVVVDEIASERAIREDKARVAHIRLIAPKGMDALADNCVTRGFAVEKAREVFLAELAKRQAPVGTPEPAAPAAAAQAPAPKLQEASDDLLVRSLCGPALGN